MSQPLDSAQTSPSSSSSPSPPMTHLFDTVVIGAGPSGLYAARHLRKQGLNVLVVEARNRVGGRTKGEIHQGKYQFDVGGQWVGPTQDRLYGLIKEFGLEIVEQNEQGKHIWELDGRSYSTSNIKIPPLHLNVLVGLDLILKKIDSMAKKVPIRRPWECPEAKKWDSISMEGWFNSSFYSKIGGSQLKSAIDLMCWALICTEPARVSFLWFLWFVNCCGGINRLLDTKGGAQQDKIVGGMVQVSQKMFDEMPENVWLNSPVERIVQRSTHAIQDDGLEAFYPVQVYIRRDEKSGIREIVNCKRVIVAVPPFCNSYISYDPPLPPSRMVLQQSWQMGHVIKTVAFYSSSFWLDKGFSGMTVSNGDSVRLTMDGTVTVDGKQICCLVGFFQGNAALVWSHRSKEERMTEVTKFYNNIFGVKEEMIDYLEHVWPADPFSSGAYMGLPGPGGQFSQVAEAVLLPFGRVHFASSEAALEWSGYIEGALEAGGRAAAEVCEALSNGNVTDFEYPEPQLLLNQTNGECSDCQISKFLLLAPVIAAVGYLLYSSFFQISK